MRILVAFEPEYRFLEDVIARAIEQQRPYINVACVGAGTVETAVELSEPHLVVSSTPRPEDVDGRLSWLHVSTEPEELSELCVNGERYVQRNPFLEEILSAIDETERLVAAGKGPNGDC